MAMSRAMAQPCQMGNRIKQERLARGVTIEQLAEMTGLSPSYLSRLQNSKRPVSLTHIDKIAEALGVDRVALVEKGVSSVPVVGYVGAGAQTTLYAEGDGEAGDEFDAVAAPENATPHTVAVEVRGVSLGELFDRWLIYYDDRRDPVTSDLVGKLCVVGLTDGRILVKKLKRGQLPGHFTLLSNTEPPIYDAALVWAARVTNMAPR